MGVSSGQAGRSPPAQASIIVYNPTASAVVVTAGAVYASMLGAAGSAVAGLAMSPAVLPLGPGMPTTVPALGSITIGPVAVVVPSTAAGNSFQNVGPATYDGDNQGAADYSPGGQGQFTVMVGATLYGSDGSLNVSGTAPYLVDVPVVPPQGFQGGYANFNAPNNSALLAVPGVV